MKASQFLIAAGAAFTASAALRSRATDSLAWRAGHSGVP